MTKLFEVVEQDIELRNQYTGSGAYPGCTPANQLTGDAVLDFQLVEPRVVLREFVLTPEDSDDSWFMEPAWLSGEQEADEDIQKGRYLEFDDAHAAVSFLRSHR